MPLRLLALILFSVLLSASAQVLLKIGAVSARGATPPGGGPVETIIAMLTTPAVLGGLFLYGASAVAWLMVLARAELSLAYPFVGLGFIATMLLGALVLGEQVSAVRVAGTLMIAVGCGLIARSA